MGALLSIPLLVVPSMGTVRYIRLPHPPSTLYLILMPLSRSSPSLQAAAELRPVLQYAVPVVNAGIGL
jgi:hypothetical protein